MTGLFLAAVLAASYGLHACGTWGIAHSTARTPLVKRELYSFAVFAAYVGMMLVVGAVLISLNLWGTPWVL